MPKTRILDVPGGDEITHHVCDESGYRIPTLADTDEARQAAFDNIPNIKCRPDDILLCAYPKTGTSWMFELLTMILNKKAAYTAQTKGPTILEANPGHVVESVPSRRILNTHVKVKYLPKEALEKKLKCIVLARNPKDVVVSFYNHTLNFKALYDYQGKFENYLQMFMRGEVDYGSYPEFLLKWQEHMDRHPDWPVHVIYYEDMNEDCMGVLEKLCRYLELDVDMQLLTDIVAVTSFKKMKVEKEKALDEATRAFFQDVTGVGFSVTCRKGEIGDWKNWFTVAQNEVFDAWWDSQTKDLTAFTFRYK